MRRTGKIDERPEIRIDRHENASLFDRQPRQGRVARVG
jgi:hypothetical protein